MQGGAQHSVSISCRIRDSGFLVETERQQRNRTSGSEVRARLRRRCCKQLQPRNVFHWLHSWTRLHRTGSPVSSASGRGVIHTPRFNPQLRERLTTLKAISFRLRSGHSGTSLLGLPLSSSRRDGALAAHSRMCGRRRPCVTHGPMNPTALSRQRHIFLATPSTNGCKFA